MPFPDRPWTLENVAARPDYSVVDVRLTAGLSIPAHVTEGEDLFVHILEGEVELVRDGRNQRLTAGTVARIARGLPRRMTVLADARLLLTSVPGGINRLTAIAADPSLDADDRAALLAAAGVVRVPAA